MNDFAVRQASRGPGTMAQPNDSDWRECHRLHTMRLLANQLDF